MTTVTTVPVTPRKQRPQRVLTVASSQWLGPHVLRLVFDCPDLTPFLDCKTDAYVKLQFAQPSDERPVTRTYTVRWVDAATSRVAIDFVTHGDSGVAAPWAALAEPGDTVVAMGPGGAYTPDPEVDWHLFAGDLSALPAIGAALAALPVDVHGVAYLEITDAGDIVDLETAAAVELRWLVNPDPDDTEFLARAVEAGPWPAHPDEVGSMQVFAHGERESIKAIRRVLKDREVPREAISISGYWARGRTEDAFQAEKREPIGRIE